MKAKAIVLSVITGIAFLASSGAAIYESVRLSSLNSQLKEAKIKIESLQKQLADANSAIIEVRSQSYDAYASEKALLEKQLSQATLTNTNLQGQLFDANAKIAGLQRIPNVTEKQPIAKDFIILQNANTKTLIATHKAERAGYLYINGYASTTLGYVLVNDTEYRVSTGIALQIPVVPGEVSVYYGNSNFMNSITGTITLVEFWY